VKAAIGEDVDNETLGGADMHSSISGVVDYAVDTDEEALATLRTLISHLKAPDRRAGFDRIAPAAPAGVRLRAAVPVDRAAAYPTETLIEALVDAGTFTPFKADYGKTIVTGYGRIDGWSVGIVANQRALVRSKKEGMQFGGVIYSDSADKAARFVMNCNLKGIPLVFLQDVSGFMVGSRSEQGGIIKDGAKLVNAVANSVVPKFTVIVGNSYGAGNYAMCGKAYDPRLIVAWPTARIAVMGGAQAAGVLASIELARLAKSGDAPDAARTEEIKAAIAARYEATTDPVYAAARLWVDAVIDPDDTRHWISTGIACADHAPIETPFNPGVLQT